jgi:hypothetical protein
MKGVYRFGIKGKLAPCYISLYPILEKYGPLAYWVGLPSRLSGVHNVFYVSQLKRHLKPSADVPIEDNIPLEPNVTYKCYPIKVLDQQDRATRKMTIRFYLKKFDLRKSSLYVHILFKKIWAPEKFPICTYFI